MRFSIWSLFVNLFYKITPFAKMDFDNYKEDDSMEKLNQARVVIAKLKIPGKQEYEDELFRNEEFLGSFLPIIESLKNNLEKPDEEKLYAINEMSNQFRALHVALQNHKIPKCDAILNNHVSHYICNALLNSPSDALVFKKNILLVAADLTKGDPVYSSELVEKSFVSGVINVLQSTLNPKIIIPAIICLSNIMISLPRAEVVDLDNAIKIVQMVSRLSDVESCKYFANFISLYFKEKKVDPLTADALLFTTRFLIGLDDSTIDEFVGYLLSGMLETKSFIMSKFAAMPIKEWIERILDTQPFVAFRFISILMREYPISYYESLSIDSGAILAKIDFEDEEMSRAAFCVLSILVRKSAAALSDPLIFNLINTLPVDAEETEFTTKNQILYLCIGIINNSPITSYTEDMISNFLSLVQSCLDDSMEESDFVELVCSLLNISDYNGTIKRESAFQEIFDEVIGTVSENIEDYDKCPPLEEFHKRYMEDGD